MNIVIPLAGVNPDFEERMLYKPFMEIDNKPLILFCTIDHLKSLKEKIGRLFFIILRQHESAHNVSKRLNASFKDFNKKIVILDKPTDGAASTVLKIKKYIDNNDELIIWLADIWFDADVVGGIEKCKKDGLGGFIPCFPSLDSKYSYVLVGSRNIIKKVAEKEVISFYATAGFYYFLHGNNFVEGAEEMIEQDLRVNSAFYIAPTFNQLIRKKKKVLMQRAKCKFTFGSYADVKIFDRKLKHRAPQYNANIYAHRGSFNSQNPENSLLAFKRALERGYSVEVDVRRTLDGVLVLSHDSSLKKAFGRDGTIESSTYHYLCKLDYFSKKNRITTFEEFLDFFKENANFYSHIAIHPKSYSDTMGDSIVRLLLKKNLIDCSFIFDVNVSQADKLKRKYPFIRIGASVVESTIQKKLQSDNYFSLNDMKKLKKFDILWIDEWQQNLYTKRNLRRILDTRKEIIAISPELHRSDGNKKDTLETWQMLLKNGCDKICTDMQEELEYILSDFYGKNRSNSI